MHLPRRHDSVCNKSKRTEQGEVPVAVSKRAHIDGCMRTGRSGRIPRSLDAQGLPHEPATPDFCERSGDEQSQ